MIEGNVGGPLDRVVGKVVRTKRGPAQREKSTGRRDSEAHHGSGTHTGKGNVMLEGRGGERGRGRGRFREVALQDAGILFPVKSRAIGGLRAVWRHQQVVENGWGQWKQEVPLVFDPPAAYIPIYQLGCSAS